MKALNILAAGLAALALCGPGTALAAQINVAVAANFTEAAREIAAAFTQKTGHDATLSFGSTGQLYTQITQDAPFEVFLAADDKRPAMAVAHGHGVEASAFTYAIGKIVLWSTSPDLVVGEETLKEAGFDKIAIANPQTAPYGAAAIEAMKSLGVYEALSEKIVQGNNIAQTLQFVQTGNAELGFVALSQIAGNSEGSRWQVPGELYQTIRQDAVLLNRGAESETAKAFMDFLKGPEARAIIEKYGYGTAAGS